MIIKGKRGETTSDEEPRPAPAAAPQQPRESALIKNRGGTAPPPDPNAQQRRSSSLMKRGTYTHSTFDEPTPEARPAPPPDESLISIPTGDRPPVQSFMPDASGGVVPAPMSMAPSGPPVNEQIIDEAKRRGEAIVRQAQLDAKKLLEESKIHCQSALEQAERDGLELGKQKGYESSQAEMAILILQVRQMLSETIYAREKVLRSCEGEIATLAGKIAERVTQTAVTTNPEIIKNQVAHALDKVKDREHIIVRVNPQDLDVVRARRDMFQKLLEGPKTFEIQGDPKVDRGGVMIETNLGNIDARISTQLQAIHIALSEVDKRLREEWERQAQMAAQQILEQGLPPELAARVQIPPPPQEMVDAAREAAMQQLIAHHQMVMQQQAAQQAAVEQLMWEQQQAAQQQAPADAAWEPQHGAAQEAAWEPQPGAAPEAAWEPQQGAHPDAAFEPQPGAGWENQQGAYDAPHDPHGMQQTIADGGQP